MCGSGELNWRVDEEGWTESSRYHNRHEMFSRRLPSLSESLHFVNTGRGDATQAEVRQEVSKRERKGRRGARTDPKAGERLSAVEVLEDVSSE